MKPRNKWDTEDYLDYNDGWHEESGLGFTSKRDPERTKHSAEIMQAGRDARVAHSCEHC